MKKLFAITSFLAVFTAAAQVTVSFRPERPETGEAVYVTVTAVLENFSGGGAELVLPKLPDGSEWNYNMRSSSTGITMTGGKRTVNYRFIRQFYAGKAGKFTIPPFKINFSGGTAASSSVPLEILPAGSRPKPAAAEKAKPYCLLSTYPARPLSPGENFRINIELFIPENYELTNISGIDLTGIGDSILQSDPNANSPYTLSNPFVITANGKRFLNYTITARAAAGISGEYHPQATIQTILRERQQDNSADEMEQFFFSGIRYSRPFRLQISGKSSEMLKIIPRPPLPSGVTDLGLTGKFDVTAKLSSRSCPSGEPVEVLLNIVPLDGSGVTGLTLKTPELKFPGFRAYPPEVSRNNGKISIRCALIPLSPGEKKLDMAFACFDPATGKYDIFRPSLMLAVTRGKVDVPAVTRPSVPTPVPAVLRSKETDLPEENVPQLLSTDKYSTVSLPLARNQYGFISFCILGGIVLITVDFLVRRFRFDPAARRRRKEVKAKIRALLHDLKDPSNAAEIMEKHGISAVAEALGLPPGASAQEVAQAIDDPEVKAFFLASGTAGFAPGGSDVQVSPGVIRFLRRLLLIMAGCFCLTLDAGDQAYRSGDFAGAQEKYRRQLRDEAVNPALLNNLACAEYQLGNYPAAQLALERAVLLAPDDAGIFSNLLLVRNKLQDPEKKDRSFAAWLKRFRDDLMRPDQYLALAAAGFFLLCVLYTLRGKGAGFWRWGAAAVISLVIIFALLAAAAQNSSTYSTGRMLVRESRVELRSIPALRTGSVITVLHGGTPLTLLEKQGSWLRVKSGSHTGWIPENSAERILHHGIF